MTEPVLPEDRARAREQLSSLMDGDGTSDCVASACRLWRQDADHRAQWHTYHLIGDVLRSEDLGQRSAADAAFLQAVRERLAREPVVLAPIEVPAARQERLESGVAVPAVANGFAPPAAGRRSVFHLRRWVAPVGMAAGVALVAGAVLVTRPGGGAPEAQSLAAVSRPDRNLPRPPAATALPATDTELVRYLDAHQQFPGTPALGPAPGFLRSAAYAPTPSQ